MAEISNKKKFYNELDNFESLQIKMASTEKILEWSHGEVTKPETINYRSLKPERDGLFCERIFGPIKDWECNCRKYKSIRYKGIVCDRCGVEVTKAKVRRERMGHIQLATPVSHIWYFKGSPSRIGVVLELTPRDLERVLYFDSYIVTDPGDTDLIYKQILREEEYREKKKEYGNRFTAGIGAEAIRKLLCDIDLDDLSAELRKAMQESDQKAAPKRPGLKKSMISQKKSKIIRRLEVVEALRLSGNRPEWMVMEVIPVIPPDLRPMVQLDGGRFATSDLNDLYRRVINRNNRLKRLLELGAPDIIVRNEQRMLQEAVDSLIDNGKRGRAVTGPGGRPLKSLSDMLKGKQGRFRQNLLGKRVDYSGRSVIVVGPELKFYQCGLPKKMALELFKPFIMRELVAKKDAPNIKNAKRLVESVDPKVWDALDTVIKDHPVLLNRAPTLHRLGIQAFEPVLVEGKAIKLHPLVCTPFNADFDGDQMAVHVPLSVEAQAEARFLMLSVNNILAPKDGLPITAPSQDMILGAYYLTYPGTCRGPKVEYTTDSRGRERMKKVLDANGEPVMISRPDEFADKKKAEKNKKEGFERIPEKGDGKAFADLNEMLMAYQAGVVSIHARVKVRRFKDEKDVRGHLVESTVGRFIYNQGFPQDLGYVDRKKDPYSLEIDFICDKNSLKQIINRCFHVHANTTTVIMMDYIKSMGYKYSTKAAVTIGVDDMKIPDTKWDIINQSQALVDQYEEAYRSGMISNSRRYEKVIEIWGETTEKLANTLMDTLPPENNLNIMAVSGARGNKNQIGQIGGMRGLMGNARGETVEIPIKANFREGLSVLEYFISSNGARKGLTDTALRTADSGYLTRRLVDVSHNVIVREYDCGTDEGVEVRALKNEGSGDDLLGLAERIAGRTSLYEIKNSKGKTIVEANEEISDEQAKAIVDEGIESVVIRSAITCRSRSGICAKCYGRNLATAEPINIGESVGIIAAQSIGEPGTQLTMRTFHTGGVAGGDITQGLPRVEELFEARNPKGLARICEANGIVTEMDVDSSPKRIVVKSTDEDDELPERVYEIMSGDRSIVKSIKVGSELHAGDNITEGPLNPHDVMRLQGVQGVYKYITKEVQKVYRREGVDINDKHIEIIISQMLSKFEITDPGDTWLLPGGMYSRVEIEEANEAAEAEGKEPAKAEHILLGITKASLATSSFLSAASFQETTKVLTDAAIKGKKDDLLGLKENVIIGKLIPAGTGMKVYRDIKVDYGANQAYIDEYMERLARERAEKADAERAAKAAEREAAQNAMNGGMVLDEMERAVAEEAAEQTILTPGLESIITDLDDMPYEDVEAEEIELKDPEI